MMRSLILVFASLLTPSGLMAEEKPDPVTPLKSGKPAGEAVPKFYARVITGPLSNRSVCFVCRNGDRPTIMILTRSLNNDLKLFLRNVDRVVDNHRATGLKSFGVLISDIPAIDAPMVQTFAFEGKIQTPLTVASDSVSSPACQNIAEDAEVTVVLYKYKRVISTHAFRKGNFGKPEMQKIFTELNELVSDNDDK